MKILRLQAESFKRLSVVDITPDGDLIRIGGKNAQGKSSVLDAIKAAIGGAAESPLKPVRTGEDYSIIRVEAGNGKEAELIVTKYFDEQGEKLKVENGDGAVFTSGQTMLSALVGRIAFDPLAFARMKPSEQAAELRRMVPLAVDLDKLADDDKADKAARRDINRDGRALAARLQAMPPVDVPDVIPDENALLEQIGKAAETNSAIERERARRLSMTETLQRRIEECEIDLARVKEMRAEADRLEADIAMRANGTDERQNELESLPPLDEPVDVSAVQEKLREARLVAQQVEKARQRAEVVKQLDEMRVESEAYTTKLNERAKLREEALAAAKMPVDGLSFAPVEDDLVVTFNGEPFEQASGAEQLRVSMALAMTANAKLRVMLIKDGSLLDEDGLAIVSEMAKAGDYQVWLESVGDDGAGIIMEAGRVRGAPDPEKLDAPKRRKPKGEGVEDDAATKAENAADLSTDDDLIPEVVENVTTGETKPVADLLGDVPSGRPARRRPPSLSELAAKPNEG